MTTKTVEELEIPVVDIILDAYNQADVGKYAEALATIKAAKSADPRNIYVIALEKQFAKLLSAPAGVSADETRASLPGLLDRALDGARTNFAIQAAETSRQANPNGLKEARLKELRDQYFSRADEFVERGDYDSALAEIRRVKIIDPDDRIARQYEEKITQLAGQPPLPPAVEKTAGKEPATAEKELRSSPPTPAAPSAKASVPEQQIVPATKEKGMSRTAFIIALTAIVTLGGVTAFFFVKRANHSSTQTIGLGTPVTTVPGIGDPVASLPAPAQSTEGTSSSSPAPSHSVGNSVSTPSSGATSKSSVKDERKATAAKEQENTKTESPSPAVTTDASKQQAQNQPAPQIQLQPVAPAPLAAATATNSSPQPSQQFIAVEKDPKILKLQRPKVPDAAARAGMTGKLIVKVQIDAQGKPTQASVVSSTNHIFDEAVVEAVMNSSYEPGMMSGGPVTSWMAIPFVFK